MNITVIGCGRWGSCLAWYFSTSGHDVLMYGRKDSESYKELSQTYKNEYLTMPANVRFTSNLTEALTRSDVIIVSIAAQNTVSLFDEIAKTNVKNKIYVLCMKGLIESDGKRLSEVATERLDYTSRVAVWVGPGHVENFTKKIPSPMSARFASSCSRNGMRPAAMEITCIGATSMYWTSAAGISQNSVFQRQVTFASANVLSSLSGALAWAITYCSSASAGRYSTVFVTLPLRTTRYGVSMKPKRLTLA